MVKPVMRRCVRQRQDFHKLSAVDVVAGALRVFRVRALFTANEVDIIMLRSSRIGSVNRNMRDAGDRRRAGPCAKAIEQERTRNPKTDFIAYQDTTENRAQHTGCREGCVRWLC